MANKTAGMKSLSENSTVGRPSWPTELKYGLEGRPTVTNLGLHPVLG